MLYLASGIWIYGFKSWCGLLWRICIIPTGIQTRLLIASFVFCPERLKSMVDDPHLRTAIENG
jgi:hypothetical protein